MTSKNTSPRAKNLLSLSALALLITGGILYAGPLNPPAGPVASTAKTLAEVEPRTAINATNTPGDADSLFKITQPGSYYLTGNITGVVGKNGIEITAGSVTLDLNGFALVGVAAMGIFDAVTVTASDRSNITVLNGTVQYWGDEGIELDGVINARVDSVKARGNAGTGIASGRSSTISNCTAYLNSGDGIRASFGSSISNCAASSNGGHGISSGSVSTISGCCTDYNVGNGIATSHGCSILNCAAYKNSDPGILTAQSCAITNCSAFDNNSDGIRTSDGCTLSGCSTYANSGEGISAGGGCTIVTCSSHTNTGHGIITLDGCTISGSTATENALRGISVNNGCQIKGSLTRNNALDGINVNFSCVVTENNCNGDGTAVGNHGGIHVLGQANRIEANNVTYADRGLLVDSGGNVIIRNSVKGCTLNWSIVANNYYGAIVDRTGVAAAAVAGNAAPSTVATTDPHANFTY